MSSTIGVTIKYLSKQRSTLSDIRSSIHSCSRAISCMSRSSPCPMDNHSSSVSGSTSPICKVNKKILNIGLKAVTCNVSTTKTQINKHAVDPSNGLLSCYSTNRYMYILIRRTDRQCAVLKLI